MRRSAAIAAAILVIVVLALGAGVVRLRLQDPLASLPRGLPGPIAVVEELRERWDGRTVLHVVLRGEAVGDVRFVVSLPEPLPAGRIPIVLVLGGLEGGTRSIRRISEAVGDPGPNAFVAYDWPLPPKEPGVLEIALRLPALRRAALSVPGQVDALLAWASVQPWGDADRVSLLGYSLGTFVAPAVQRIVEQRGGDVRWTILAYAGAPIGAVIAGHPAVRPGWARRPLGAGIDLLLRPVEPSEHLPHLHGRFLVLRAARDRLIAAAAADRLVELTPQPRTVVVIEGDHMGLGPEKRKLLAKVVALSRAWLIEQGAIVPATVGASQPGAPRARTSVRGADVSFAR